VLLQVPRRNSHRKIDIRRRKDNGEDHALFSGENDLAPLVLELAVEGEDAVERGGEGGSERLI